MTFSALRQRLLTALAALSFSSAVFAAGHLPDLAVEPRPLPAFQQTAPDAWINTAPLTLADLKGQVVLIEVWTTV
jgi:hypothetical protein